MVSEIPAIFSVPELSKALIKVASAINTIRINTRLRMSPPQGGVFTCKP
jgi:hypothetical protein